MRVVPAWRLGLVAAVLPLVVAACAPTASAPAAAPGVAGRPPRGSAAPAASSATAPAPSPQLQALIQAARDEGQLTLVTAGIDNPEERRRLNEGFNREYGLNVRLQFTPNPNMPEMANRLAQELQAGRPASSDVFLGTESHVAQLMRLGALEPADYASWAPNLQNPALLGPDGMSAQIVTRTPGITYNSNRLRADAVPTSLQDLLKPQYKDRVASTPYAGAFTNLASPELWGETRATDFVRKYSDRLAGLMGCGEGERVANGEFDLFALDCGGAEVLRYQAKGAPLAHVIPSDVAILVYWYVAVPRHAPHPNAAKLWVNYLLGREAQDVIYEYEFFDHHRVPGSRTAPAVEQLQARGVQFAEIDVDWSQRHAEQVPRLRTQLEGLLKKQS